MKKILTSAFLAACAFSAFAAERSVYPLSDNWEFMRLQGAMKGTTTNRVSVPHTWNAEYTDGKREYNRETMVYRRTLTELAERSDLADKRVFLVFDGVNSVADVFLNRRTVGQHKGGYTAFSFEITDQLTQPTNIVEVWVSNAHRSDVLPLSGDFNVYGGIHRPVRLVVTERDCISPVYFGSSGILVRQKTITRERAEFTVEAHLLRANPKKVLTVRSRVYAPDGSLVAENAVQTVADTTRVPFVLEKPELWNGKRGAALYRIETELVRGDEVVDRVDVKTGFRFFSVDAEKGFFLNGEPYQLYGFNRHDDFKGVGSALTEKEYARDRELIRESGATMLRLAHYPHGEPIYDICDEDGVVLWTELPFCGPGGYPFTGYVKNVEENARQALDELIAQKMNHPSILFWGLFNEILADDGRRFRAYDPPAPFLAELNDRAHLLDPSRLTTFALCVDQSAYYGCADLLAYNKYFGWKVADEMAAKTFDGFCERAGSIPVGVSEYGRAGSLIQHADPLYDDKIPSRWNPEEQQVACHERYWSAFRTRPQLWARIIWQYSDMQSAVKDTGDRAGINDKGMVSYDRQDRKDAFYFYKANWNPEPMLHLNAKRFTERKHALTEVRGYSTVGAVTLTVNGENLGTKEPDEMKRVVFGDVNLKPGENTIRLEATAPDGTLLTDTAVWRLAE